MEVHQDGKPTPSIYFLSIHPSLSARVALALEENIHLVRLTVLAHSFARSNLRHTMGSSTSDKRDIYYRKSKADGYRARSAYKLLQLDEMYGFLGRRSRHAAQASWNFPPDGSVPVLKPHARALAPKELRGCSSADETDDAMRYPPPRRAVDLCAAPGSWSQVLRANLPPEAAIVSVDLQPMAPIPGVVEILGDITSPETAATVVDALQHPDRTRGAKSSGTSPLPRGRRDEKPVPLADLVVCDGAPDVTGVHDLDEYLHAQLLLAAVQITFRILEKSGTFVAKVFTLPDESSEGLLSSTLPSWSESTLPSSSLDSTSPASLEREKVLHGFQVGTPGTSGFLLRQKMLPWFDHVDIIKPRSSRPTSVEHFLVCRGFRPPVVAGGPETQSSTVAMEERHRVAEALGSYLDQRLAQQKRSALPAPGLETRGDPNAPGSWGSKVAITACGDLSAWDARAATLST